MQVDKIGCMWMKVDAGGPEYDVRVPGIPGTGIFLIFLVVSEKIGSGQSLGAGIQKIGTGKSLGTNIGKNWYRKKVSEPVSVKFAKILDIYDGIGTGTGNFSFLLVVSEPVSE